jgi:hypothetical protein
MTALLANSSPPPAGQSALVKRAASSEAGVSTSQRRTRSKGLLLGLETTTEPSALMALLMEAEAAPEEDAADLLFEAPAADDEPYEEYDEGDVLDDERPPFADAEPESADPALLAQIDDAAEEDEGAEYEPAENELEPEEEYEEGNVVAEEEEEQEEEEEEEEEQ